jgi:hypothetical protein
MPAFLKTLAIFLLILAIFAGITWLGLRTLARTPAKATALPVHQQPADAPKPVSPSPPAP